jgi:DnaK suppressor protein
MDLQRLEFFKKLITDELAQYINEPKFKEKLTEPVNQPVDLVDRATFEMERRQHFTFKVRCDGRIRELRDTLARMENGTYGVCSDCEEEIPEKRLTARPTTKLCIACQETREKRQSPKELGKLIGSVPLPHFSPVR